MKPFLKWAGGKRQLLPHIQKFINENNILNHRYYEPFIGGGSVFFNLEYNNCVINDLNEEIINVYKIIKRCPHKLIKLLRIHEKNHNHEYYYYIRELDRDSQIYNKLTDVQKAARTIYLNKTCYNGLYRVNRLGQFNTPIGNYKKPLICDEENILLISNFLRNNRIKIMSKDFEIAVKTAKNGDWIYFDPPYDYEIDGFVNYVKEGFNHDDLRRLKSVCDSLIKKGCNVLISNNDTKFVRDLFSTTDYRIIYHTSKIKANRNINSDKDKRKKVDEVLIYGTKK